MFRVRFQDARFQQLVVDYQNKLLQAQAEVDNAIVAYLRAQVRASFLAESANAAERSVQLSFVQYREGATDFNSVLLTLTEQFQQQDALTEARGQVVSNLISTYKALGGGWQVVDGHHLQKVFPFPDFVTALDFTNRVGELAEQEGHHPDICLSWGRVEVEIFTHKIDGLTESDFVLAARIDRL